MFVSRRALFTCAAVSVLGALGCGGDGPGPQKTGKGGVALASRIRGGGSSFIGPMIEVWKADYQNTEIDYQVTGSGDGVQKLIAKERDFGCTDAALTAEQIEKAGGKAEILQIPLAMGAVVPIYNLKELTAPLNFTGELLANIYLGKISKWNDPAIAAINPGVTLPDTKITVCARSDNSGTSHIFTSYLSAVSPEWKEKVGASTGPKWPVGQSGLKNAGVAKMVDENAGAIGYVELLYALDKKGLKYGKVQNSEKSAFIAGSLESVTAAAANLKEIPEDLVFSLIQQPGKDSYPICGTVWLVAFAKGEASKVEAIKDFVRYATGKGQELCGAKHYAKLPDNVVKKIAKLLGDSSKS